MDTSSIDTAFLHAKGPHVTKVPLQTISRLAPFSALIISIILVNYFIIRFYILEAFLLKRIYGTIYTKMDETTRRGFVNHHIAGSTKILILVIAAYLFINVAFGNCYFPYTICRVSFVYPRRCTHHCCPDAHRHVRL
jgi:hypothetical protein